MKNLFIALTLIFMFNSHSSLAKNKVWNCINQQGQTVFTINAMHVYNFHNGLALVYKNTLVNNAWVTGYGYINQRGEVVIPCNLKKANDFIGDYTWVMLPNQDHYTLINKSGQIIPTKPYKKVGYFYDFQKDICAVYENEKMGFIDMTGKEIIPCKYLGLNYFENGLCSVSLYDSESSKYGYINKKGEVVIPINFKQAGPSNFEEGYARVKVNGKTVLIDTTGKVVFKTIHGNIQSVNGDLISVFSGRNRTNWGWVNFKDKIIIPQKYAHATSFNKDGLAVVELNGLKGVIDMTGKIVIPIKYKTVYCDVTDDGFIMGVYPTKENKSLMESKRDYYDKDYNLINISQYQYVQHANGSSLIPFQQHDQWGFLNKAYQIVIPAQFKKVKTFSEGLAFVRKV